MKGPLTKTAVISYLAAIFLVGAVAGFIGGYCAGARAQFKPPGGGALSAKMAGYLKTKLHLTEKQLAQVQPVLDKTAAEFESIHSNSTFCINEVFQRANEGITPFLDADQKALLADLERQRQEQFQKFLKPEPAPRKP